MNIVRLCGRFKSTAEWVAWQRDNPVPPEGELLYDVTENRCKMGDGVHPWGELVYIGEQFVLLKIKQHNEDKYAHRNIYLTFPMIDGKLPVSRVDGLDEFVSKAISDSTGDFLTDAPNDGRQYGRQSGAWVVIDTGEGGGAGESGIEEAPQDGKQYARQNGRWVEIKASSGGESGGGTTTATFTSLPYTVPGDASSRWRVKFTYVTKTTEFNTGAEPSGDPIATYDKTVAGGTVISGYTMGGKGVWKCWGDADGEGESQYKWEYIYTSTVGTATKVS